MESSFITSVCQIHQFPEHPLAEIAFVGKSNSGKSSLINALVGRRNLARKSSRPGSTDMINFYQVAFSALCKYVFADLPGYGYSRTQKSVQSEWNALAASYFQRDQVQKILFLMDVRRDFEPYEVSFLKDISRRKMIELFCVLTKTDKVSAKELAEKKSLLEKQLKKISRNPILIKPVSSLKNKGIEDLRLTLAKLNE